MGEWLPHLTARGVHGTQPFQASSFIFGIQLREAGQGRRFVFRYNFSCLKSRGPASPNDGGTCQQGDATAGNALIAVC
eukprot:13597419-Alexandrium_andersonii.AAC.1